MTVSADAALEKRMDKDADSRMVAEAFNRYSNFQSLWLNSRRNAQYERHECDERSFLLLIP